MSIKDLFFGSLDQVMITIELQKVDRAEEIFKKYNGKQVLKKRVSRCFTPLGFSLEIDSDEPNRVTLCYLVIAADYYKIFHELADENIAGNSRHNPVYSRPYSLSRRIRRLALRFQR